MTKKRKKGASTRGTAKKGEAEEDNSPFGKLFKKSKNRFRDQVIVIIRNAQMSDLADPSLGLIKRQILAKTNSLVGRAAAERGLVQRICGRAAVATADFRSGSLLIRWPSRDARLGSRFARRRLPVAMEANRRKKFSAREGLVRVPQGINPPQGGRGRDSDGRRTRPKRARSRRCAVAPSPGFLCGRRSEAIRPEKSAGCPRRCGFVRPRRDRSIAETVGRRSVWNGRG